MGQRKPSSQKFHQPEEDKVAMYAYMKNDDNSLTVSSFVEGK